MPTTFVPDGDVADPRGRILAGSELSYQAAAESPDDGEVVQYMQVVMVEGTVIDRMETFLSTGTTDEIRMGIYSQSDPTDADGAPLTRVAQTGPRVMGGGDEGSFVIEALLSNFTVPSGGGFFWLAWIADGTNGKWGVTGLFPAGFAFRQEQSSTGSDLPVSASGLSAPGSAAIYVAARVEGT